MQLLDFITLCSRLQANFFTEIPTADRSNFKRFLDSIAKNNWQANPETSEMACILFTRKISHINSNRWWKSMQISLQLSNAVETLKNKNYSSHIQPILCPRYDAKQLALEQRAAIIFHQFPSFSLFSSHFFFGHFSHSLKFNHMTWSSFEWTWHIV